MLSTKDKATRNLITKAFSKLSKYEPLWLEYERMYKSLHTKKFLDAAKDQERNAIFIPLTYSTINIADSVFTSAFFSNGNPIEISKVGAKDEDKRSHLSRIVEYYYSKAQPYNELSKAFLSAALFGIGAVKIFWNESKKIPDTTMLPPTEVAFDIDAISAKDNQYIPYKFEQSLQEIDAKIKSKFYKVNKLDKDTLLKNLEKSPYSRKKIEEVFKKSSKGWDVLTFCGSILLRKKDFKRCPIKFGYLLHSLPAIDSTTRANQIAAIGDSLARIIKPLNEELNVKRNQRMDIIEKHINPDVYVPKAAALDEDDANKNGGIKYCDKTAGILFAPITGASEFTNDSMLIKSDIEDASSINGIMRGNTSPSDRRSGSALANVNANSSIRLESMIKLISETLFEHWAKDFVRLCYINASDELINEILEIPEGENHSLGSKGTRAELEIDIKINFGMSINKQAKIQDLINIAQLLQERDGANTDGLIKQIIRLTLGENSNIDEILGVSKLQGNEETPGGDGSGNEKVTSSVDDVRPGGDSGDNLRNEGNTRAKEIRRITNNQI